MQKKLIALAVAAAFSAPAFADVTMYGLVDAAVVRASGDGQESDMIAYSGGLSGSRLGAKSATDLDNGMKAVAVLEYNLDAATDTGFGTARQEMLALAGGFGTVAAGYLQTTGYDFAVKFDPTAGSAVSPLQNVTKANFVLGSAAIAARAPRALAYISPDMSGLVAAFNYSTSVAALGGTDLGNLAQASDVKNSAYLMSLTYDAGPLAVGGVYTSVTAAGDKYATEFALGASYDLGVAKLFGTFQSQKVDATDASNKALSFSAVAPVGPGAVAFTYAKNDMDAADSNASGMTVAWLQGLSKTTTLYAAYSSMSQDSATNAYSVIGNALSNANLDAGGKSSLMAVGIRQKF